MSHCTAPLPKNGKPWTALDLATLRIVFPAEPMHLIAKLLGRSENAIYNKASQLDIRRATWRTENSEDPEWLHIREAATERTRLRQLRSALQAAEARLAEQISHFSDEAIASRCGIDRESVAAKVKYMKTLGIVPPVRGAEVQSSFTVLVQEDEHTHRI